MARKQKSVDVRALLGAAVVFALIGIAIFSAYFFLVLRPAAEELQRAKESALNEIKATLGEINTDQAQAAASDYTSRIMAAGSKSEVSSIMVEVTKTTQLERERERLLNKIQMATTGTYHSTADVPLLASLAENLNAEINSKSTLSELKRMDGVIDNEATSVWRTYFMNLLSRIENDTVIMKHNSPTSWIYLPKDNALETVLASDWQTLRELHFEGTEELKVPIIDTLQRSPLVLPGSTVNVYVYDLSTNDMSMLVGNAEVSEIFCSDEELRTINWAQTIDQTSYTYSTDIWETIKAAAAGSSQAASVYLQDYITNVLKRLQQSGVGNCEISMIYVIKVPREAGELILQYEFYQASSKDIVLASVV